MSDIWKNLGMFQMYMVVAMTLGMIWAFPLMWAWNYTMTYIFGLPVITWLHSWLLYSILTGLWKVTVIGDLGKKK